MKKSTGAIKMDQLDRLIDSLNTIFFNYEQKKVILYIDQSINYVNKNIAEQIGKLKENGITVVNSLDEFGGVLK